MYLSVSTSDPGTKPRISRVMLQVTLDYKIQLVSCKMFLKCILGLSTLKDLLDAYIFSNSFCSVLLSDAFIIFINVYAQVIGFYVLQVTLFYEFSGFVQSVIQWSYDLHLKNVFVFQLLRSVRLFFGLHELKDELNFLLIFLFICF